MPFKIIKTGQIIEDKDLRRYLTEKTTIRQFYDWIDQHEEPYSIFGTQYSAHVVATRLFGDARCRKMITDFVVDMGDQDYDFKPFGLKYIEKAPAKPRRRV